MPWGPFPSIMAGIMLAIPPGPIFSNISGIISFILVAMPSGLFLPIHRFIIVLSIPLVHL